MALRATITISNRVSILKVNHDDLPTMQDLESLLESMEGIAGGILVIDPRYSGHQATIAAIIAECRQKFNCLVVDSVVVFSRLHSHPVGSIYELNSLDLVNSDDVATGHY